MKKILLCIAILCLCLVGQAQKIRTMSSCDTNLDGDVNIEDITKATDEVLDGGKNDFVVVKAQQLNDILTKVNKKLDQLQEVQKQLEVLKRCYAQIAEMEGLKTPTQIEEEVNVNGHEYVDLGLSVRWATCNVGASTPTGYGNYYAWGETATKYSYYWSTYELAGGSSTTMKKYCTSTQYGTVDDLTTLEKADDAAYVNWGGAWRLPTSDEMKELCDKCDWSSTTQNGVKGYLIESKINGKTIFLPAAGLKEGSTVLYPTTGAYYWTSSLDTDSPEKAHNVAKSVMGTVSRFFGRSVRAVLPK